MQSKPTAEYAARIRYPPRYALRRQFTASVRHRSGEVKNPTPSTSTRESFEVSRNVLAAMIRVVDAMIAAAMGHPAAAQELTAGFCSRPETQRVLLAMLQALGSSTNTIVGLSHGPGLQSRDCFSISRSVAEVSVNICYILAEGESAALKAQRHAQQKAFRDLGRESTVGSQTISLRSSALEGFEMPTELQASLEEFTSSTGREKGWNELSIDQRSERIGEVLGHEVLTPLHWARFAVYRHSSEILHGTFFGAVFFMGLTATDGGPRSADDWLETISGQHLMILMSVVLSIVAVARAVNVSLGAPDLVAEAERQVAALKQAPFFRKSAGAPADV